MKRLGIYIQVPFCQTKCTYCNFHTGVVSSGRFAPYVEAVCREVRGWQRFQEESGILWGSGPSKLGLDEQRVTSGEREEGGASPSPTGGVASVVDTVYFGGGTPSLLEPGLLQRMMNAIRETFENELSEVTLEADPETVEAEKAVAWVRALPKDGEIQLSNSVKLEFYGLYKQATEGEVQGGQPWAVQIEARAKWDAWNSRKGMTSDEAKAAYVEALTKVVGEQGHDWRATA